MIFFYILYIYKIFLFFVFLFFQPLFAASQGDQEDAFLLHIVEGYCAPTIQAKRAGSGTQTASSHEYDPPQLIVAENEKMFVEEMVGDEVVVKERYSESGASCGGGVWSLVLCNFPVQGSDFFPSSFPRHA